MALRHPLSLHALDWPASKSWPVHCTDHFNHRVIVLAEPRGFALNLYMIALIWMSHNFFFCLACPVQKTGRVRETSTLACVDGSWECTFAQLDKILNDAARHPVDGRIYLPIDNNKEKSNATADNLPIVLANSGDEAIFHCPLPLTPNITVMPDIAWAHNGQVVTVNSSNSIDVTARYDASPAVEIPASAATLILKNAKWSDRGVVECQQTCPDEPLRFCRLQAFRLRVTPTASELFPIPLPNVTVRRAAEARLQCVTSVTHPMEQFDSHIGFIWRFNRQWLEAPKRHPLRALIFINPESSQRSFRKYVPPDAVALDTVSEYGVEYSPTGRRATTLVLPRVQARSTARIECWVRPDYTREVWLMQTAYLHVV